jgi:tRNA threonylcarbamoyladenosine biosynthesis protein TsaE
MRIELWAQTPEDTRAVGEAIADVLEAGDAVALTGDLGAGKTTLVKGVAAGLGSEDVVASPTFVLVREYRGRLPIHHVDVYRVDRVQDVIELDLDGMAESGGVVLVEWGDAVEPLLPEHHLRVELRLSDPDGASEARRIVIDGAGSSWGARWERLEALLAATEVRP